MLFAAWAGAQLTSKLASWQPAATAWNHGAREGGIHALQGVDMCCCYSDDSPKQVGHCAADRTSDRRLWVCWWRLRAAQVLSLHAVRDSNPSQPGSKPGALPTELTVVVIRMAPS